MMVSMRLSFLAIALSSPLLASNSVTLKRVPARGDDARDPASVAESYAATRDALAARAAMKAAAQETASASAQNTMSRDGGGA